MRVQLEGCCRPKVQGHDAHDERADDAEARCASWGTSAWRARADGCATGRRAGYAFRSAASATQRHDARRCAAVGRRASSAGATARLRRAGARTRCTAGFRSATRWRPRWLRSATRWTRSAPRFRSPTRCTRWLRSTTRATGFRRAPSRLRRTRCTDATSGRGSANTSTRQSARRHHGRGCEHGLQPLRPTESVRRSARTRRAARRSVWTAARRVRRSSSRWCLRRARWWPAARW
jgi:hypothetical protein